MATYRAPKNLYGEPGTTAGDVLFKWEAAESEIALTQYNVYVNGSLSDTVTINQSLVSGFTSGTDYDVKVSAVFADSTIKSTKIKYRNSIPNYIPPKITRVARGSNYDIAVITWIPAQPVSLATACELKIIYTVPGPTVLVQAVATTDTSFTTPMVMSALEGQYIITVTTTFIGGHTEVGSAYYYNGPP